MGGWDGLIIMIVVGVGFGAFSILLSRFLGKSLLERPLPLYVGEMHVVTERS